MLPPSTLVWSQEILPACLPVICDDISQLKVVWVKRKQVRTGSLHEI